MGGEHRDDQTLAEQRPHLVLGDALFGERIQDVVEPDGVLAEAGAPRLHGVLRRVGGLQEAGEAVHDLERRVGRQPLQERRQLARGALEMAGDGEPPHRLDTLEGRGVILADDLAEKRADFLGRGAHVIGRGRSHESPVWTSGENLRREAVFLGAEASRTDP